MQPIGAGQGLASLIESLPPLAEAITDKEMGLAAQVGRGSPYEEPKEETNSFRGFFAAGIGRGPPYGGP